MTSPTPSSKAWLRLRDSKLSDLKRAMRKDGIRVRRKLRSDAFERGAKAAWSLEPAGTKVKPQVAEKVRSHVAIVSVTGRFGEVRYSWRRAA